MPIKLKSIFIYVLGSMVMLFCLFVYWASREIPLPNNAKKRGEMIHIDISEGATDPIEKAEATFVVPEKFKPQVFDRGFAFYFKFPQGTPYSGNDFPLPKDQIRVVLTHHVKTSALPSEYLLRELQAKDGLLKNVPYFVENKNEVEIYKYDYGSDRKTIGTYFKFVKTDGATLVIGDAGDWSRDYEVHGKLSPHVELLSLPPKNLVRDPKHFIEDISAVDNVVLKLVQSFQTN